MTDERKEELRQLLEEALVDLEIIPRYTHPPLSPVDVDQYKWSLQESWMSFSPNIDWLVGQFKFKINRDTESRLLCLIRKELDPFIHEDRISTGYFYLLCVLTHNDRFELNELLDKLVNIAIFGGIETAVSSFAKCVSKDASAPFESITLLEGITIESEVQIFDGIRLVPIEASSNLPRCLGSLPQSDSGDFYWKTMLVIDYSISPIFQKPFLAVSVDKPRTVFREVPPVEIEGFQIKAKGVNFPEYTSTSNTVFHQKFCQALSLACNSGVKPSMSWKFVAKDELININPSKTRLCSKSPGPFGDRVKVSEDQINKAKYLYNALVNSTSNTVTTIGKELQIPIDRWVASKTSHAPEDKMIDLGIAFESLYLPSNRVDQLAFQFRLRASWHLGKNKTEREKLMDEFREIYTQRSKAVHNGTVSDKIQIRKGENRIDRSEFIQRAQDLCRASIIKILEDGEFPDWNNLILGEESS